MRAPEPATLYRMHGSLSGAYRVRNVAARNRVALTNTIPSGLNRGFGGPQLYFGLERTMAIAARRLGLDPADARAAKPRRRGRDAVPDAFGGALRLGRLRSVSRPGARALRAGTSFARPGRGSAGGGAARRRRARVRRGAVDLEHGLHHARADRGRASGRRCRSRATPRAPRSRSTRSAGSPCGSGRHRRDRAIARSARRSSPMSSAAPPRT